MTPAEFDERLARVSDLDIAWFGGWLCADGCIFFDKDGRPGLKVAITDLDPVEKFSELFGGRVLGPYDRSPNKPVYVWGFSGFKAVALLRRSRPWLSIRYGEKADRAMAFPMREHRGRSLTPADVAAIRRELIVSPGYGVGRRLSRRYGITDAMVTSIRRGRSWSWVKPRVYLSGGMRGYPFYNFPAFFAAETELVEAGWEVHNPARWDQENGFEPALSGNEDDFDVEAALRHDITVVVTWAQAVVVLPKWELSEGAKLEVAVAQACGIPVYTLGDYETADTVEMVVA